MTEPASRPMYFLVCRDCIAVVTPDRACWRCAGTVLTMVDDEEDADLCLNLSVTSSSDGLKVSLSSEWTERFRLWMESLRKS